MNRTCIFASYDANGIIQDYVVSYLKFLKEISNEIIFIADCSYADNELTKISPYITYSECMKHSEYDFGSYKRGLRYLLDRDNGEIVSDELILCNDSCFCISSLIDVFISMENRNCDVWSATKSIDPVEHLQSYFLVFKKNVINNKAILNYFLNVEKKDSFYDVVFSYETPLLSLLKKLDFSTDSFAAPHAVNNPTMFPVDLLNQGLPLVKRKLFTDRKATKQSFFKLISKIKDISFSSYKDILKYYRVSFGFQIWFKYYFLKKMKPFSVEQFDSGIVRYRVFAIPFFYKKRNSNMDNK